MKDLIVVGAGPAGLVAASTAAKLGLKVVVIEKKKDITKITRACSAQFVLDEGYEDETIYLKDNKVIFTKNKFEVPYTGRTIDIISNNWISPKGHKVHFAHPNQRPSAVKFDKGHLIRDLREECEKLGVEMRFETIAYDGEDKGNEINLRIRKNGKSECISARKLIIAEGVNAHLTGVFGLNKQRRLFGMPLVTSYTLVNTKGFERQSWNQLFGDVYHPFADIMVGASIEDIDTVELTITGMKDLKPDMFFQKLVKDSPLSENLRNAEVINKTGCAVRSYTPIEQPYIGNVLAIGDSAAHIEVIVQGALMCGFNAGQAVAKELAGEEGFKEYTSWWRKAFEFNRMDGTEFVKLYGTLGIKASFKDDEIDYLFALIEGKDLCGNFSQFEVPKTLWRELLKHREQIRKDRPEIFEKIQPIETLKEQGLLD